MAAAPLQLPPCCVNIAQPDDACGPPALAPADEPGLINRVAGVFARRGANIESLAVGLTVDKALFTIVATGTDAVVANLSKQVRRRQQRILRAAAPGCILCAAACRWKPARLAHAVWPLPTPAQAS